MKPRYVVANLIYRVPTAASVNGALLQHPNTRDVDCTQEIRVLIMLKGDEARSTLEIRELTDAENCVIDEEYER